MNKKLSVVLSVLALAGFNGKSMANPPGKVVNAVHNERSGGNEISHGGTGGGSRPGGAVRSSGGAAASRGVGSRAAVVRNNPNARLGITANGESGGQRSVNLNPDGNFTANFRNAYSQAPSKLIVGGTSYTKGSLREQKAFITNTPSAIRNASRTCSIAGKPAQIAGVGVTGGGVVLTASQQSLDGIADAVAAQVGNASKLPAKLTIGTNTFTLLSPLSNQSFLRGDFSGAVKPKIKGSDRQATQFFIINTDPNSTSGECTSTYSGVSSLF